MMNSAATQPPKREPVSVDLHFGDFTLQPLNPRYSGSTRIAAPCKPKMDSRTDETELDTVNQSSTGLWTPFYLKRTVLLGFVTVFITLFVILAALFGYSQNNQGLSTADQKDYYLWTYGPTAVLTIIAAFWAQVVYRTKQLMPWRAMATNPQPASKSVALDYVSPMNPVALFVAVSNSHYTVSLVIFSSFMFTALITSSTGLLTTQYVDMTTQNAPLITTNKFDLSNFDWSSTDAQPTAAAYAAKHLGLAYPSGTTARYAVQDFTDPHDSNVTMSGIVDTFSAWLDCEPATLFVINVSKVMFGTPEDTAVSFTANVTGSDCMITNFTITASDGIDYLDPQNATYSIGWGSGQIVDCVQDDEYRILVSWGSINVQELWNVTEQDGGTEYSLIIPYTQMFHITNNTNILCTPRYGIARSMVRKRSKSALQTVFESITPVDHKSSQIGSAIDIARGIFQSINDPTTENFYSNNSDPTTSLDMFFTLLAQESPFSNSPGATSRFWLQYENLVHHSSTLYGSIAAQLAATKLTITTTEGFLGNITTNEPRLLVRVLSFTLMETCLAVLIATTVCLLLSASRPVLSHDPGSIAGMAAILGNSLDLISLVGCRGHLEQSKINDALRDSTYCTSLPSKTLRQFGTNISISGTAQMDVPSSKVASSSSSIQWWQPLILRMVPRLLVVIIPLVYIAILEILFRTGQSNDGLLDVQTNSWLHYGWTYIPALVMVCVCLAYDSVSFSVQMLSPYSALQGKSVPSRISVQDHPLSRFALHELFISVTRRQVAVSFATTAALLAPLLTIVVSGLYTADNFTIRAGVRQLTGWTFDVEHFPNSTLVQNVFDHMNESNPTNPSVSFRLNPTIMDLVVTANLSYPRWTYNELALPVIEVTTLENNDKILSTSLNGTLEVSLPAIRGGLNCSVLARDQVNITYTKYNATLYSQYYYDTSGWFGRDMAGNRPRLREKEGTTGARVALFSTKNGHSIGDCLVSFMTVFLPASVAGPQAFGYFSRISTFNGSQTWCPLYSGMFGSTTATEIEDYTWFYCSTFVESVVTQTTFTFPEYNITAAQPDESTATRVVKNTTSILKTYFDNSDNTTSQWQNDTLGVNSIDAVEANDYLTFYNVTDGQNYDNFFSALVYGRDGVPANELLGEANTPRLFSAVQHLWRVIYAQDFRTSNIYLSAEPETIRDWAPSQPWNGTFMDPRSYRLKQSAISTRILQTVLATLSLCAIVTFVSMDTRRVLPNNPSSIAVMASLLAGSETLSIATSNHEEKRGHEPARHNDNKPGRWQGYFFSLGWWDRPDGSRRFGIDIGKAAKAT